MEDEDSVDVLIWWLWVDIIKLFVKFLGALWKGAQGVVSAVQNG